MDRASHVLEKCFALLVALYILSGRWGVYRLTDGKPSWYLEPRFYIVSLVILVTAIYLYCHSRTNHEVARGMNISVLTWTYFSQLAMYGFFLFSLSWSPDYELGAKKAYEVVLLAVLSTSSFIFLMSGEGHRLVAPFWKSMVGFCGVLAVLAVVELVANRSDRLATLGGGPNVFSRLMGLLCIAGFYFSRNTEGGKIWFFPILAGGLLSLLSGSRGGMIALLFALLAFCWSERVKLRSIVFATVSGSVIVAATLLYTSIGDRIVTTFQERFIKLLIEERYTSGRGEIFRAAIDMGRSSWFAGEGLAGFPAWYPEYYPHNIFLECFSEGGSVGLALVLFSIIPTLYWGLRRKPFIDGPMFASFILILVASQFSGDLFDSRGIFLFALLGFARGRREIRDMLSAKGGA